MAKTKRILSGAAKDAYLARAIAAETDLDAAALIRLMARLQEDVALVSLRVPAAIQAAKASNTSCAASVRRATAIAASGSSASHETTISPTQTAVPPVTTATSPTPTFDPYSPNVIVVIRTRGRDAVLAELHDIQDIDCLRLLAREQQLGIAPDLDSPSDIRLAIVAAAERRIANRRAAAS